MKKIIIAAGGTGGHINAALAMKEAFSNDFETMFYTGKRHLDYKLFKGETVTHIDSRPLRSKNPIKLLMSISINMISFLKILINYTFERPKFIIGAGGYVCGPTLFAGFILRIPLFIIEQNAVMGLTNRILSIFSSKIFTSYETTKGLSCKYTSKVINSGNPIRNSIKPNPNTVSDIEVRILVFGGSLGAMQINDSIKELVKMNFKKKLKVTHQVGKGNLSKYELNDNITYKQVEYIDDMNEEYKNSNIIIARAGASTISELEIVKRPSILIPYPLATDDHQTHNANSLKAKGEFYVAVTDHKKTAREIAEILYKEIEKIDSEGLYIGSGTCNRERASELIVKGIKNCLV